MLGYPEAALVDAESALKDAREIGQAVTLMYALFHGPLTHMLCGNYPTATMEADEVCRIGGSKGRVGL